MNAERRLITAVKKARGRWIPVALIVCASGYLALHGLGAPAFWDDEAQVAIVAHNFNRTGALAGWDGRNLYAYENGTLLDAHLRPRNPPFDYLLCAASFRLLGESTWTARFPFTLAGLLTLAAFYWLLRRDFRDDRPTQLYALGALAFSVVFLLNVRQCRYYAPAMLLAVLTFLAYRRCMTGRRWYAGALLGLAAVGFFAANYLLAAAFLLGLGATHLVFHARMCRRAQWLRLGLGALVFLVAALPYALAFRIWERPDMPHTDPWLVRRAVLLWWNVRELNTLTAMPWAMAIALVVVLLRFRHRLLHARTALEWTALCGFGLAALVLLSPQRTRWRDWYAEMRYLVFLLPFLAGLVGVVLGALHRRRAEAAAFVLVAYLSTNALALAPGNAFRVLLPAFVAEIHSPRPTAYGEAAAWLRANTRPDERVLAYPDYTNYPLMYYLGDRLRFCCLLTKDEKTLPPALVNSLDAPLWREENYPDVLLLFGRDKPALELRRYFERPHVENGRTVRYVYRQVAMLDCYWDATGRPELPLHRFRPRTDFDRQWEAVYVYRRGPREDAP